MADYIEVDIATLGQDIGELKEVLNSIRRDMQSMFESVRELDRMWEGPSNAAFNRQFDMDWRMMEVVCKAVEGVIDGMGNAKNSYLKCEMDVKMEVDQIRI